MKKTLSIICLILTACFLFGCTKKQEDGEPETEPGTGSPESEVQESFDFITDGKTDFEIIYPADASKAEIDASVQVSKIISEKFGIRINQKDDFLKGGTVHTDVSRKILIGKTNFEDSQKVYETLKYQDYSLTVANENIVISAYTKEGFDQAIRLFEESVVPKYDGKNLKLPSASALSGSCVKAYEITSWTLCSKDLNQFSIIYSDKKDRSYIEKLRTEIAELSGNYLEIYLDTEKEPGENEILFGDTNRKESAEVPAPSALNYVIEVVNGKLVVRTGGRESAISVYKDFVSIVAEGTSKVRMGSSYSLTGDFFDDPVSKPKPDAADLRLVSLNAMANIKGYDGEAREAGYEFERRLEIFYGFLDFYQPDVIGLQEFCPDWYSGFEKYEHADVWELIKIKNPNIPEEYTFTTVAYRKDLFTLIDSGCKFYEAGQNDRCRSYNWVVLKDKSTGKEFCFVSTHWDQEMRLPEVAATEVRELSDFVNQMAKKYPVYTTGDFNNNEWTNSIKNYLKNTASYDSMYAAKDRLNQIASWHEWGTQNHSSGSCDHVTATSKDSEVLQFETVCYNKQVFASDHAWLVADIKIK